MTLATIFANAGAVYIDQPSDTVKGYFNSTNQIFTSWVDIYEADNTTVWVQRAPLQGGTVTLDSNRAERRNVQLELVDDGTLPYSTTDGLWYDKIVKPYAGVIVGDTAYVACLGEFMIDRLERPHFPNIVTVSGRDFTKKLLLDKFNATTTFSAGQAFETIIRTIATNGGISKMALSATGKTTGEDYTFERGTDRWAAIAALALAVGYEVFFDNYGYLTLRPMTDPATSALAHTFLTGSTGNLASWKKVTEDTRMRNHVIVYGDGTDNPLVFGEAENTRPESPTRIARLGRRTEVITTAFIDNDTDAEALAETMLKVMALEQYDVTIEALTAPWLEVGETIEFLDPNAEVTEPTRFLLSSLTLPLVPGTMSANAKRVHLV